MRIAIALSLLLVALVVGGLLLLPRLIDWNDYRDELTGRAAALTGQAVAIRGRIDLELLPRPTLTLAQTTLSSDPAAPAGRTLIVDRLDLRLKPLPLLAGRFEVDEIRLVRPLLQIAQSQDAGGVLLALAGGGPMLPLAADGPRRLSVVDGRIALDGAAPRELEALNLELVAAGADGPYTLAGAVLIGAQPFDFNARLGPLAPDSWSTLQLEINAAGDTGPTSLQYRGVTWSDPGAPRLRGELVLSGGDARAGLRALANLSGQPVPPLPDWLAAGFRLAGHLEFADGAAVLDELQLALGELEAGGELRLAQGTPPALDLQLEVARLTAPEVLLPDGHGLALLAALAGMAAGRIDLAVDEMTWRGGAIQRLRTTLALDGAGGLAVEQARAILPGQTSLGFTGALAGTSGEPELAGELTVVASDLPGVLAWLEVPPTALPEGRLRTLSLTSGLAISDGTLRFTDSELRVDASRLSGSLALSLGPRTQIAGALELDRLNLDAYWPQGEVRQLVDGTLAAFGRFDAAVEARIKRLTWHGVRLQDLVLDGRSVAGRLTIDQLMTDDLAGNHGRLTGEVDLEGGGYDLAAELDSTRPAQLLRTLGLDPPLMLARLTPLQIEGTLKGNLKTSQLDLKLRHDAARIALAGALDWTTGQPAYDLAVDASHPDYPALLEELGIPRTSDAERRAAVSVTGRVQGDRSALAAAVGNVRLGATSLTGRAGWQRGPPRPKLTLHLSVGEPEAAVLQDLLALSGLRVDVARLERPRPGAWSTDPLELRWLTLFDAELDLSGKGGVVDTGLELSARLEQGRLLIDRLAAGLWGGQAEIQCSFDAWRPLPFMALAVDLRAIDPTALAAWLDLPPVIEGPTDLYAEATAAGHDLRMLIGGLIGEVRVTLPDGKLAASAPLARLQESEALDGVAPGNAPHAGAPPASAIAAAPAPALELSDLAGSFAVKRGIATTDGLRFKLARQPARLEGSIDLLLWAADLKLKLGSAADRAGNEPGLQLVGPLDRPQIRPLPSPTPEPILP